MNVVYLFPGKPSVMDYRILGNKREVLTRDTRGEVVLWDILHVSACYQCHVGRAGHHKTMEYLSFFSLPPSLPPHLNLDQGQKKCELGVVDIDDEAEKRKEDLYVPNWFTCDIKTGVSP